MAKESRNTTLKLGGASRRLVFDYAALCELCDAIGCTVSNMQEAMNNLRVGQMHLLIWAGLLDEDPTLTPDQVKAWLKAESIPDAQAMIGTASQAFGAAMVRPAAKAEGEAAPADPKTPATDGK